MLIDFCHHSVGSKVRCDKISRDGYEVTNLIAEDIALKKNGFMAEHFIKPPVNITIKFPCNISIHKIIINPVIGQQQSCDLKLFTASVPVLQSWLYKNEDKNDFISTDGILFNFVGSISQQNPSIVSFENSAFKERSMWRNDKSSDFGSVSVCSRLNHRKMSALTDVSHVSCTITKVKEGKTAAIKQIEIWGAPSHRVPTVLQSMLKSTFVQAISIKKITENDPNKKNKSNAQCDSRQSTSQNFNDQVLVCDGVNVPEDFIDQITFDIMSVPVLLPCGKNIDLSTLERFTNTEASWGRGPSDPFTSLTFTSDRKAVTNTSLKARIDHFVMENSGKLKNVARTLGDSTTGRVLAKFKPSSLIDCQDSAVKDAVSDVRKLDVNEAYNGTVHVGFRKSSIEKLTKRKLPGIVQEEKICSKKVKLSESYNCVSKLSSDLSCKSKGNDSCQSARKVSKTSSSATIGSPTSSLSHGEQLSQSLNDALASTLSYLPCYSSQKHTDIVEKKHSHCCKCNLDCSSSSIVKYKLTCDHIMCRACLQQMSGKFTCFTCYNVCLSDQVIRVFY